MCMQSSLSELLKWVFTPAFCISIFLYGWRFLRAKPNLKIEIHGDGYNQGGGRFAGTLHFRWYRDFVFHNDSDYLARGLKLISRVPQGCKFETSLPTKLGGDEKYSLKVQIEREENQASLMQWYGDQHLKLGSLFLPKVLDEIILQVMFKNKFGRSFYQVFHFSNGIIHSEVRWTKMK